MFSNSLIFLHTTCDYYGWWEENCFLKVLDYFRISYQRYILSKLFQKCRLPHLLNCHSQKLKKMLLFFHRLFVTFFFFFPLINGIKIQPESMQLSNLKRPNASSWDLLSLGKMLTYHHQKCSLCWGKQKTWLRKSQGWSPSRNNSSSPWSRHRTPHRWGADQGDMNYGAKSSGDWAGASVVSILPLSKVWCK